MTDRKETQAPRSGFWRRLGRALFQFGAAAEMSETELIERRLAALEQALKAREAEEPRG